MADDFREGNVRTPPAMKSFAAAVGRDLPNALARATRLAVAMRAAAGTRKPRGKR